MSIYLKVPNVSGNVTTKNYEGWVSLDDVEFAGIVNRIKMKTGQVTDRLGSYPCIGEVTFIKSQDKTSHAFFEAAHNGQTFPQLQIDYVTNENNPTAFSKLILKNAAVTLFADKYNAHSNEQPKEIVRVIYSQMQRTHIPRDNQHKFGSPISTGYDLEKATKV